jgi:hypothetical protein
VKLVRNKTGKPVRVPLEGSHFLHLGPHKTGQVSDRAVERQPFHLLVERGEIEIVGHGDGAAEGRGSPQVLGESTHGHQPPRVVLPSGNRSGGDGGRGR